MDVEKYTDEFQKAQRQLDKTALNQKQLEIAVGNVLNSVFLKLYKKSWANPGTDPLTAESRIFFSVWINDATIENQKIFYNIHALKLRHLKGYSIQSRKFAESFRKKFKAYEHSWQNVSVNFGPLTLMEGWLNIDLENFQDEIINLANQFLKIEHLIDDTLKEFKY